MFAKAAKWKVPEYNILVTNTDAPSSRQSLSAHSLAVFAAKYV
jgi:hypothetical protein